MIRELDKRISSHRNSWEAARSWIIKSLGMNPRKGGSPPREKRAKNDMAFTLALVIDLICLKWKT